MAVPDDLEAFFHDTPAPADHSARTFVRIAESIPEGWELDFIMNRRPALTRIENPRLGLVIEDDNLWAYERIALLMLLPSFDELADLADRLQAAAEKAHADRVGYGEKA